MLIATGAVLLLCLISYRVQDLPDWISFSRGKPVGNSNIFGIIGTVLAGYSFFLLGGAAFFLPMGLVWFGVAKILMRLRLLWRPTLGMAVMISSLAVLLALQSVMLDDWDVRYNILGAGGGLGWLGNRMASVTVGGFGVGLLAVAGILFGAVLSFGMRPVEAMHATQRWFDDWRERRVLAKLAAAEAEATEEREALKSERLALREERAAKRAARRKLADDDMVIPGGEVAAILQGELPLQPSMAHSDPAPEPFEPEEPEEPEIIDGTARKAEVDPAQRKMSLAEWRKQRQGKKPDSSGGMASALSPLHEAFRDYQLPDLDMLHWDDATERKPTDKGALLATQGTIVKTLESFGVKVTPGTITRGPSITRYEIYPTDGLRVNKIVQLEADLARATKAEFINILAPIPGKDTVGIEIANSDKVPVPLRELLEDPKFHRGKARIPLALGKDVYGETIIADLASMPHLLVAGTTGSGKSVCINSIIASLLFQFSPDQLRFIMVDPKVVEMQVYSDLPHLIVPVVTEPKRVVAALKWVVNEMDHRYRIFAKEGARNFESFNSRKRKTPATPPAPRRTARPKPAVSPDEPELPLFDPLPDGHSFIEQPSPVDDPNLVMHAVQVPQDSLSEEEAAAAEVEAYYTEDEGAYHEPEEDEIPDTVPYIVVIIDELADLMQTAPADVENLIARLTQKARAAGIHLIVATQTPRANVITGVIKANIPCRIAFQVASGLDSRVILDTNGAEKLVGKGDMLYLPPGTSKHTRAQGAFIMDDEISTLVEHCKAQGKPMYDQSVQESIKAASDDEEEVEDLNEEDEELLEKCIEVILQERIASTSRLQRRLKLGYTRAARCMDILEKRGIVGPGEGAKPREILISADDPLA